MSFVALPAFKNSTKAGKRRRGHVHGRYCGKGMKGQKSRSGRTHVAILEGGQMPLVRRLPKRGFSNRRFAKKYEEVNLDKLSGIFTENGEVTAQSLKEKKIIKGKLPVKLLGRGEISVPLTIKLSKISSGALKKIKKAGGTVIEESPPLVAERRAGKMEEQKKNPRLPKRSGGQEKSKIGSKGGEKKSKPVRRPSSADKPKKREKN